MVFATKASKTLSEDIKPNTFRIMYVFSTLLNLLYKIQILKLGVFLFDFCF